MKKKDRESVRQSEEKVQWLCVNHANCSMHLKMQKMSLSSVRMNKLLHFFIVIFSCSNENGLCFDFLQQRNGLNSFSFLLLRTPNLGGV